ncbi:hypothetical protein F2Q70_00029732 [Brassica cretica]|uniref:Uncharacterized protein n=2 Tax=Brassica cretica TaxID=69181 RepID=A0A8S9FP49_BRACR|nr:hypothetical protein F2Q70_00029732 [Brassica cretica]KAF2552888.1 hypothetical protein F2Q68_00035176 [Brassica cretica]KAF3495464.1 hypothetical protein DY000_02052714 [Brassica cretica]
MCTHCLTYSEHVRAGHLDKTLPCPFCHALFLATESSFQRWSMGSHSSDSLLLKQHHAVAQVIPLQTLTHEADMATGNPYSRFEDLNSTHEAHRLFSRI